MNKKKKSKPKRKIFWERVIILIFFIIGIIAGFYYYEEENEIKQTILNMETNYTEQLKQKDEQINTLEEEKTNLNTKVEELNKEIEALKVAKAKKATITSRGGSKASRETVQASAPLNEDWIWANASAYCACVKCCGKTNGITASGTKATAGRTIAAPKNYPFGTKIEIAGMGTYVVEDRGGAITGNKIDIYFDSHAEALKFGRRNLQIKVLD
jgi:3D (Asp-Asp-Asp) domain-containing protein